MTPFQPKLIGYPHMSSLLNTHASCDLTSYIAPHFYGRVTWRNCIMQAYYQQIQYLSFLELIVETLTWPSMHKLSLFSKNDTNLRLLKPHWKESYQLLLIINIEVKCQEIGPWILVFQLKRFYISTSWTSMHRNKFLRKPEAKANY